MDDSMVDVLQLSFGTDTQRLSSTIFTSYAADPLNSPSFSPYQSAHSDRLSTYVSAQSGSHSTYTSAESGSHSNYTSAESGRHSTYTSAQSRRSLFSKAKETLDISDLLDWSGRGQHVSFEETESLPFRVEPTAIDKGSTAIIDVVQCRRIRLARKLIRCKSSFPLEEALTEVASLQRLEHSHVIRIVGSYYQGRDLGILLYPVADTNLSEFLHDASEGIFSGVTRKEDIWTFTGCFIHAVEYIHSHNIKHLDIKPSNILLRRIFAEDYLHVYIADFGASKKFEEEQSQTGNVGRQTPKYSSPEVSNQESKGRASDIFSLGCIFVEILTVGAGLSLTDLARSIWSRDRPQVYSLSISEVKDWINSTIIRLETGDLFSSEHPRTSFMGVTVFSSMLNEKPDSRPTASTLLQSFYARKCCTTGPEPFATTGEQVLHAANAGEWVVVRAALQKSSISGLDPYWYALTCKAAKDGPEDIFLSFLQIRGDRNDHKSHSLSKFGGRFNRMTIGLFSWEILNLDWFTWTFSAIGDPEHLFKSRGSDFFAKWVIQSNDLDWIGHEAAELLRWACRRNKLTLLKFLISKGAVDEVASLPFDLLTRKSFEGLLPLAFESNATEVVQYLIENGHCTDFQLQKQSFYGHLRYFPVIHKGLLPEFGLAKCNALHLAACLSEPGLAQWLLDHGAEVNSAVILSIVTPNSELACERDLLGPTPLMLAAFLNKPAVVSLLLNYGADVDAKTGLAGTALNFCLEGLTRLEVLEILLEAGAEVNTSGRHGLTPLMYASNHGKEEQVKKLLNYGAMLNAHDQAGYTPLIHAVLGGYASTITRLVNSGADVNAQDRCGRTALMYAIKKGNPYQVSLLLNKNRNINVQDKDGMTVLHHAIKNGTSTSMVEKLLRNGADHQVRDHNDMSALSMALLEVGKKYTPPFSPVLRDGPAFEMPSDVLLNHGASFTIQDYHALKREANAIGKWHVICSALVAGKKRCSDCSPQIRSSYLSRMKPIFDMIGEQEGWVGYEGKSEPDSAMMDLTE